MAKLVSSTRSAARATYSAYRSVPIRWRLAGGSAALTFVILAGFAVIVGTLTNSQVRSQFTAQQSQVFERLVAQLNHRLSFDAHGRLQCEKANVDLRDVATYENAQIRIFDPADGLQLCNQNHIRLSKATPLKTEYFNTAPGRTSGTFIANGYRVAVRTINVRPNSQAVLLYALPLSDVEHTVAEVQVFLLLGVLGGTFLALIAGLLVSARAVRPIVELTEAAGEIARTRDASRQVPHPEANDEIAELARTLQGMLGALDAARSETQGMLDRQREFVADASHELRTPLTSVLANLELLTEELAGEQAETAEAALRSTRRMRRLVGDLLLLARADARRVQPRRGTDLAEVLVEAAGELGPMADHHDLSLRPGPAPVIGVRDELHRLALNLLENAVRHTPPGTRIAATHRAGRRAGRAHRHRRRSRDHPRAAGSRVRALRPRGPRRRPRLGSGAGHRALGRAVARRIGPPRGPRERERDLLRHPSAGRSAPGRGTGRGHPVRGGSDLDDDGQDHRAPAQPLVDEFAEIVVQLLLQQADLPDALGGDAGQ